jgi:sugar phosphate isomerase/epimerase
VTDAGRALSLAHLSLLHLAPPELVRVARAAGFDRVGALRLTPTRDGRGHDLLGDAGLRARTVAAVQDSSLPVLDVELLRLGPTTTAADTEPLLAAGAELGARHVLCTVEDPEHGRRAETLALVSALATTYRLRCMVEPMVFTEVRTPHEAMVLLDAADARDAGVLVDALHLYRAGGSAGDVAAIDPRRLPYVQLCDAHGSGPAASRQAALDEAVGQRLPPGEGDLPLGDLLGAVPPMADVSVEVPHPGSRADPLGWAERLHAATRRVLAGNC